MSQSRKIAVEHIVRLREFPSAKSVPPDSSPREPLFVYCSTPRPVQDAEISGGPLGRPLYRDNVPKPEGWHSYYNLSWDPRVKRGDPMQTRRLKEELECEKIRRKLAEPRKSSGRKVALEKHAARMSDPQVMVRNANLRYARLAISNLRPKEKDAFYADLTDELDQDELCRKNQKGARVFPKAPSRKKNLVDNSTEILDGDFYDFDKEVTPVLERLIGAVCHQARLEVLEEAELEALKMEREWFENRQEREAEEQRKMEERLEKNREELKRQQELLNTQAKDAANGRVAFSLFAGVYIKYTMEEAGEALGEDWKAAERIREAIEGEFNPWLNDEVFDKVMLYKSSTKMLDDIIRKALSDRAADYGTVMFDESTDEAEGFDFSVLESSRVPPPTPGSTDYYTSDEEGEDSNPRNVFFPGLNE